MAEFVSKSCGGEVCGCGAPATRKLEETIFQDDPNPVRHPMTAYVCGECFDRVMSPHKDRACRRAFHAWLEEHPEYANRPAILLWDTFCGGWKAREAQDDE